MYIDVNNLQRRYQTTLRRIKFLSTLRKILGLSQTENIDQNQWDAIQLPLAAVENRLISHLKIHGGGYLPFLHIPDVARKLNVLLGRIEMELTDIMVFFDTYMDILSQRRIHSLGSQLKGCDRLAEDALSINHRIFTELEKPIVSCERGFGALIIRAGATFPGGIKNPVPLIQIPYSRFITKYDLTSVIHEVGHDALARLGMNHTLPKVFEAALIHQGAPREIIKLYSLWSSEIGPDFWGFCCAGMAQTLSIKELLSLPPNRVFHFSSDDPHPAIYIRILLSIEWCKQLWGRGQWDLWKQEWDTLYPLQFASKNSDVLKVCREYVPIVARALLSTKFSVLDGKKLPNLFDMKSLLPENIERIVESSKTGTLNIKGLRPCAQLGVFRLVREKGDLSEDILDKMMTEWLLKLGQSSQIQKAILQNRY